MKRWLIMFTVLAWFAAPNAHAQAYIQLHANDCSVSGVVSVLNACNADAGSIWLFGSATLPELLSGVIGMRAEIAVYTCDGSPLPPWWQMQAGGCRDGALTGSFDFATFGSCSDPWLGTASGHVDYVLLAPSLARISVSCDLPPAQPATLQANAENYLFQVRIAKTGTVLPSPCSGYTTPMQFDFQHVVLLQTGSSVDIFESASWPTLVGYNTGSPPDGPPTSCMNVVPARKSTWGWVKAIYR